MSFLGDLLNTIGGAFAPHPQQTQGLPARPMAHMAQKAAQPLPQGQDPASLGYPPEITYNPNPNTNIPYSAHSPQMAQLGNQYVQNPTAPQFLGVDPAQFGFPADVSAGQQPFRGPLTVGQFNYGMGPTARAQGPAYQRQYLPSSNSPFKSDNLGA